MKYTSSQWLWYQFLHSSVHWCTSYHHSVIFRWKHIFTAIHLLSSLFVQGIIVLKRSCDSILRSRSLLFGNKFALICCNCLVKPKYIAACPCRIDCIIHGNCAILQMLDCCILYARKRQMWTNWCEALPVHSLLTTVENLEFNLINSAFTKLVIFMILVKFRSPHVVFFFGPTKS